MTSSPSFAARRALVVVAAALIAAWIASAPAAGSGTLTSPLLSLITFASPLRSVDAGSRVTYTLMLSNQGPVTASNTLVTSALPEHTRFVASSGDFQSLTFVSPLRPGDSLAWLLGPLAPDGRQIKTITLVVAVKRDTPTHSRIRLTSTASACETLSVTSVITHVVNQGVAPVTPAQGGQIDNGDLVLTFPPAAVTRTVEITYTSLTTPTLNARTMRSVGRSFTLEASDASGQPVHRFQRAYTLTFRYTDEDVAAAGLQESQLNLYFFDEHARMWMPILPCAGCSVDAEANVITAVLDHFTEFALGATSTVYLPAVFRTP